MTDLAWRPICAPRYSSQASAPKGQVASDWASHEGSPDPWEETWFSTVMSSCCAFPAHGQPAPLPARAHRLVRKMQGSGADPDRHEHSIDSAVVEDSTTPEQGARGHDLLLDHQVPVHDHR